QDRVRSSRESVSHQILSPTPVLIKFARTTIDFRAFALPQTSDPMHWNLSTANPAIDRYPVPEVPEALLNGTPTLRTLKRALVGKNCHESLIVTKSPAECADRDPPRRRFE